MDPFSYVCILTSIVAGLAMTRLVGGIGQLLQTRKRTPAYWVHSLWMVNVLMTVIITWWVQYRWRNIEQWSLFLVLWLLVAPITLYLASALLFPNEQEGEPIKDWRQHYYEHHRGIFVLIGMNFAIDIVDTLLKGWEHFRSLGPLYAGRCCSSSCCVRSRRLRNRPGIIPASPFSTLSITAPCSAATCCG